MSDDQTLHTFEVRLAVRFKHRTRLELTSLDHARVLAEDKLCDAVEELKTPDDVQRLIDNAEFTIIRDRELR